MPDFSFERRFSLTIEGPICGIDEAGRGPLAGPVVAAAVILDPKNLPPGIDDSKALKPAAREALFQALRASAICGLGAASVAEIEKLNILGATMLAMCRALKALPERPAFALVDGNRLPKDLACPAEAVVDGDAKVLSIAAASIVAKVIRDRLMERLHQRYPGYDWAANKGYGTERHLQGLELHGPTRHHRIGFAPLRRFASQDVVLVD